MNTTNPVTTTSPASPLFLVILSIIFISIGAVCGLLVPDWVTPKITSETILTQGKISAFATDPQDSSMKADVYTFSTKDGQSVTVQSNTWSNLSVHHLNQPVAIYYNPTEPQKAWIKDDDALNLIITTTRLVGAVFFLVGLGFFIFRNKLVNRSIMISKTFGNVDTTDWS